MALVLSRSLSTASLASLPSSSSFLLRNSNRNRVLNLTTAFVPQNGLRKRFSSSGLKWKYERRNHQFALWCKAAAVAEKEAADTSSEKFEYQAEVRPFSIFPFNFVYPLLKREKKKKDWFPQPICYMFYMNTALQWSSSKINFWSISNMEYQFSAVKIHISYHQWPIYLIFCWIFRLH